MNKCWYLVPADGVKGKTWGPSTVHQKERAHIRPVVTDGERQWSRSAPNLEKSQKGALAAAAASAAAAAAHSHLPPIPTSSTLPDFGQYDLIHLQLTLEIIARFLMYIRFNFLANFH